MSRLRRVHVLGGGSLGSLFISHFARAGVQPTLLVRPATAAALGERCSVRVTEEEGSAMNEQSIHCESTDAVGGKPYDLLVVAVKAFDVQAALSHVRARVSGSSTVILLCNGALAVADRLPAHGGPLLVATTTHGAWSRGPRDVHHAGKGDTWIGACGPQLVNELSVESPDSGLTFFARHGLGAHAESPPATVRRLWLKLAANAVLNPLTALWDCPNGEVLSRAEGRETAWAVCEEIAGVANGLVANKQQPASAPTFTTDELVDFVHECAAANALNFSSMCMDVRHGRRTEIEELNGWIARKGHELGLASASAIRDGGSMSSWVGINERLAASIRARHPGGSQVPG